MKRILLLVIIITALASCSSNITPDGKIIEERREITHFRTLEISSGIKVEFSQSDEDFAIIETFEKVLPYVKVNNIGTLLKISLDENSPFDYIPTLKVRINAPELSSVKASGDSQIKIMTNLSSGSFDIHLNTGSSFTMEEDSIFTTESLLVSLENGSQCTIRGSSEKLTTTINGGSSFYGFNFATEEVDATVVLNSLMETFASKKYIFVAEGNSTIKYKGDAKGTSYASGGSKIESL